MRLSDRIKRKRKSKKAGPSSSIAGDILLQQIEDFSGKIGLNYRSISVPTLFTNPKVLRARLSDEAMRAGSSSAPLSPFLYSELNGARSQSAEVEESQEEAIVDNDERSRANIGENDLTRIGRYRAWHPEASLVKNLPQKVGWKREYAPTLEEIDALYKLPARRLRPRDDGVGGAVMFQPTEQPPIGVEDMIARVYELPEGARCNFPDRGTWNSMLESHQKPQLKRTFYNGSCIPSKNLNLSSSKNFGKRETEEGKMPAVLPSPETDLVLDYIKTADDAVTFFVENEGNTRVKYFYCNRADTGNIFSPYDLVIVKRADIHPEFFCISASGLVHFEPGNGSSREGSFIPLEDWMREKFVFSLLRRIRFFGKYLVQKCFNIWRRQIGKSHFRRVKDELITKLFLAKPAFATALCKIRALIYDLTQQAILNISLNHLYNLDDFVNLQNVQRLEKVVPTMDQIADKVLEVLSTVCSEAKKQAQIYRESVKDEAELDDIVGVNLHQSRGSKVQSMVSIKKEKIERAKTYRRVVAEEKMLGNFIRLADYMFVEGLVLRATTATEELLDMLEYCRVRVDKVSKGVFLSTVSFGERDIAFSPDKPDILNVLNNSIDGIMNMVQAAPRILHMRVFLPYFETKAVGMNPFSIMKMTPYLSQLRERIVQAVTTDFLSARQYVQIFEEHRGLFIFGENWNFEAYATEKRTVRMYREEMSRQREWRIELERMRTANVVGILHIDSRSLRNALIPITTRTLDSIKGLLVKNAREDTLAVLSAFQDKIRQLEERPGLLDDFVEYIKMYEKMMEGKKSALNDALVVDDMYSLLGAYEVKVPTNDQVKLDGLHEIVLKYEDSIEAADLFIEENKSDMRENLDNKVNSLSEELLNILGTLHSGKYLLPDSDPAEVVSDLTQINARLTDIRSKTDQYKGYQKLFQMAVDDMSNLTLTEKECSLRWNVWKALNDWIIMTRTWRTAAVQQLKASEVTGTTDEYVKDAYRMGKANKEDTVVYRLKDCIDEFKKVSCSTMYLQFIILE